MKKQFYLIAALVIIFGSAGTIYADEPVDTYRGLDDYSGEISFSYGAFDFEYEIIDTYSLFCIGGDFDIYGGVFIISRSHEISPLPEPATIVLLGIGLTGLSGIRKRMRQ
jgi:hypothetical protein